MSGIRFLNRDSQRRRRSAGGRGGFTLIEVLMVVTVLAIIAGVVVPQVTDVIDDAKNSAMLYDLREISLLIERYRFEHNGNPPDLIENETLVQLIEKTDADGNRGAGPQFIYGPYAGKIPPNALNAVSRVFRINTAPPDNLSSRVGWIYHPASGQVWAGLYPEYVDLGSVDGEGSTGP